MATIPSVDAMAAPKSRRGKSWGLGFFVCLQFCFPPGEIYPRSTGRLIVFALYGPFNEEGNLTCGFRGSHVLSSVELESMIDDIDEEDIVSVYVVRPRCDVLLPCAHLMRRCTFCLSW